MSLKAELQSWNTALDAYDAGEYAKSLEVFSSMDPTSKILTNIGLILATVGEHEKAVETFIQAIDLDKYLAVAYFQCGVSNFLLGRYDFALKDFEDAWLYLRGNREIRYEQLGLKFVLYAAEVLFNKGLTLIYSGYAEEGMLYLKRAKDAKVTEDHDVIEEAIQLRGEQFTVFSIPVGIIYRPSASKLKNAQTKDYIGQAKLVASSETNDAYTEFTGVTRMKKGITPNGLLRAESDSNLPSKVLDTEGDPYQALIRSRTEPARPASDVAPASEPRRSRSSTNPSNPTAESTLLQKPSPRLTTRANVKEWVDKVPPLIQPPKKPASHEKQDSRKRQTTSEKDGTDSQQLEYYFDAYNTDSSPSPLSSRKGSPVGRGRRNPGRQVPFPSRKAIPFHDSSKSVPPSVRGRQASFTNREASSKKSYSRRHRDHIGSFAGGHVMLREEEEGYASWDGSDEPERRKIRVKLHYRNDIRGMALWPDTPFHDFMQMVTKKFGSSNGLGLKFKDDDGVVISLKDESDYELAIETASVRESPTGVLESKLEVWCVDL